MRGLIYLLCFLSLLYSTISSAENSSRVTVCIDADPPSPEDAISDTETIKSTEFHGVSEDIVRAAFGLMHFKVDFNGNLPWQRCLYEVELGHIDFALGAYFNIERTKIFAYSIHYNTLTPQIFFLNSTSISISKLSDLKQYRGCGIYGSSYAHYDLKPDDLDLGSGYDSLFRKIFAKRCDYFVEELEAVVGIKRGKEFMDNPLIRHEPVVGAESPSRHLITAKNGKGASLLNELNSALDNVIKSGKAEKIWKKYEGDLPYKP